jgi:hypothetical protein
MEFNYTLLQKNNIYEQIYDLLEDNDLSMNNNNHYESIKNHIARLFTKSHKSIQISESFTTKEDMFEELMVNITKNNDDECLQGNTLLSYANDDNMYELVFLENIKKEYNDNELNQFASISNIELAPVYGDCGIVKTCYENGSLINKQMNINDIIQIIMGNFYHSGVMINTDGTMLELDFPGDNPNIKIGPKFKQQSPINVFGLVLVGYFEDYDQTQAQAQAQVQDKVQDKVQDQAQLGQLANSSNSANSANSANSSKSNNLASILYGIPINGRVYITTLCPITNKRFWSLSITTIKNLIKLLSNTDNEKIKMLNKELLDDKLTNPFFLIKKYCV